MSKSSEKEKELPIRKGINSDFEASQIEEN